MSLNTGPTYPAPDYPPPPSAPYSYNYSQAPGYYPGPMAPSTNGYAIASLVCSLLGIFPVPFIGSLLAVIFGVVSLRQIRGSYGRMQGRGLAIAGITIGALGLIFCACLIIGLIAVASDPNLQQYLSQPS